MRPESSMATGCYESLLNGDATERSLREPLTEERWKAVGNGVAAGLLVVALLPAGGADAALTAGLAVLAVLLGTVFHQLLLVAGVLVTRVHGRFARESVRPA